MLAAVLGLGALTRYAVTPGAAPEPPPVWPDDPRLALARDRPTLVMAVHPLCPCSRASLSELEVLLARIGGRLDTRVLFVEPTSGALEATDADLWEQAGRIPGVERIRDQGGRIAARFHLTTSGHCVLYTADGALRFSGGITGARGHAGDNAGRAAIAAIVMNDEGRDDRSFVFGCPLFDPAWLADLARSVPIFGSGPLPRGRSQ